MAVVLKVRCEGEIYRLRLPADQKLTHSSLVAALTKVQSRASNLQTKYRDEEGDLCLLTELTFQDFLCVSEKKASGNQTYEVELAALAAKVSAKVHPEDSDLESCGSGSSDGSGDSGSSDGSGGDEHRGGGRHREGPPEHLAVGFLEALAAEYVRGVRGGVGHFLKRERVSHQLAKCADSVQRKIRRHREPAAFIAELARDWRMPCPEACCGVATLATAGPKGEVPEIPEGMEVVAKGFLAALFAEYVAGEENGVGTFLKTIRNGPRDVGKVLRRLENDIRHASDKRRAIGRLAEHWGLPPPTACQMPSSACRGEAKTRGAPCSLSEAVARDFLASLRAQYLDGEEGAVGEFYQASGLLADMKQTLELYEEGIRKGRRDFASAIAQLADDWGLDAFGPETEAPNTEDNKALAEFSPAAAAAAEPSAPNFSIPVHVGDGSILTLTWNLGDDVQAVAAAFAAEHGLPQEEVPGIAAYIGSCTC